MKKIQKQSIPQFGVQPSDLYHHLLWTITPRPVWIVGTCNKGGSPNLSTITCVSNTPGPPENIIVSMTAKRTIANIQRTGEFSVNLCNVEMASLADYVGSVSGEDGAKDAIPYDFAWGEKAHVPILGASHCVLECKVSHTHLVGTFHTFFGEVLNLQIDTILTPVTDSQEATLNWFRSIDIHKMDPLIYHSIQKYYRVGEKV
ncbi:MAG: flavin reductase family protein [Defluviitaleaceae bacterium]|nr:flavin reductase family protein [Defluviitaleaceae bacterium]